VPLGVTGFPTTRSGSMITPTEPFGVASAVVLLAKFQSGIRDSKFRRPKVAAWMPKLTHVAKVRKFLIKGIVVAKAIIAVRDGGSRSGIIYL
jgi:hypothetical protein